MVRRTKEEAQETRNLLLDTAEHVFQEKGVSRTSLNDIAKAAGLTRGAIYWHFTNKADLFDAMMGRVTLPVEEMQKRVMDKTIADPLSQVRACALNILNRVATDVQCQRVFEIVSHKCEYVDEMAQVHERHVEGRAQCLKKIEQGIRNAVDKNQLPATTHARHAAVGLHALIDGLISNWVLDQSYFRLAVEAEKIVDIYINGLKATPATAARKRSTATIKKAKPASRKSV
ncbi:MAG: TetR family transcriptional regulator [Pseudomonadota bacterium]